MQETRAENQVIGRPGRQTNAHVRRHSLTAIEVDGRGRVIDQIEEEGRDDAEAQPAAVLEEAPIDEQEDAKVSHHREAAAEHGADHHETSDEHGDGSPLDSTNDDSTSDSTNDSTGDVKSDDDRKSLIVYIDRNKDDGRRHAGTTGSGTLNGGTTHPLNSLHNDTVIVVVNNAKRYSKLIMVLGDKATREQHLKAAITSSSLVKAAVES